MELWDDSKCFACGKSNPIGLKLEFEISEGGRRVKTECLPNPWFQGWSNIVHGGIIATILDEAISRIGTVIWGASLTAYLQVRFRKALRGGRGHEDQEQICGGESPDEPWRRDDRRRGDRQMRESYG